jgi:hypothetical protein
MEDKDERGKGFGSGLVAAILIGFMIYFFILILDNIDSGHWGRVIFGVFVEAVFALLTYGCFKGWEY